ncbi:MAG TPA: sensor histidine kinase [Chitinophagaceae bacterium]|nr:sensor histidine kinase [Chitinophagaceae bacterium]
MGQYKNLTLFILLIFPCYFLPAQNIPEPKDTAACIDISKISFVRTIHDKVIVSFVNPRLLLQENFPKLVFNSPEPGFIPNKLVTKKAITRFLICNTADTTVSIWFFPGFYYWKVQLYQAKGTQLSPLPVILPEKSDNISYRKISLAAHDSMIVVAELTFAKTYLNTIRPRLIHPGYFDSFLIEIRNTRSQTNIISYIFCGLLLMMILYSLANFFQGANKDFLYYSGYALSIGLMLLLKAIYNFRSTPMSLFQDEYLDFVMQDIGYLFYMVFMQKYLVTKTKHPFLYKLYNIGIAMTLISAVGYTYFHYLSDNFVIENWIENLTKYFLLFLNIIFLIYSFSHWKDKLLRYLFWGNLCLLIFSGISQWAILSDHIVRQLPGIFQSSLFYYEVGVFLELVFFLMALNHKSRRELIYQARERERLKAENQMKEYEKELAVFKAQQQERERISADMHDELGSGMTAIRLMSEIARNKMKQDTPAEIEKISQSADEVLNKMNAIIWSMNSGNDTIDNLVSYIRSYALEYFENTHIDCKVTTPDFIEPKELTGDKRRNIFLCVKETLNNALKHSKASTIRIDFKIDNNLFIKIADNGVGIDLENIRQFGNGLKNISRRMESIGGAYQIERNNGTVTTLTLPL